MKYFLYVFCLLTVTISFSQLPNKFPEELKAILYDPSTDPKLKNFLKTINDQLEIEKKVNTNLKFGVTGSNSQNRDLTQFNIGAELKQGFFPGELKFKSDLNIQFQDGEFVENFSDLNMSYDIHIGNDLRYEGYAFLKRSVNNFLNIDQRYEAGVGGIFNIVTSSRNLYKRDTVEIKKSLTIKGVGRKKLLNLLRYKIDNKTIADGDEFVELVMKELYEAIKNRKIDSLTRRGIDTTEAETIVKAIFPKSKITSKKEFYKRIRKTVLSSIEKKAFKVRLSFLGGINYESERTSEMINIIGSEIDTTFAPTNLFRAVVAPRLQLNIDQFTFSSRCFLKMAISEGDYRNVVMNATETLRDSKIDYRLEWFNSAVIKITEKLSVEATYKYVHINAPKRIYIDDELFSAANRFNNFNLGFKIAL